MANPGSLILGFVAAAGGVAARRIVKFGVADGEIATAASAADHAIGVSEKLDAAAGQVADVILDGSAEVVAGGAVAAGASVTADAQGRAVAAAAGQVAVGFALASASAAGDIIDVKIARHAAA